MSNIKGPLNPSATTLKLPEFPSSKNSSQDTNPHAHKKAVLDFRKSGSHIDDSTPKFSTDHLTKINVIVPPGKRITLTFVGRDTADTNHLSRTVTIINRKNFPPTLFSFSLDEKGMPSLRVNKPADEPRPAAHPITEDKLLECKDKESLQYFKPLNPNLPSLPKQGNSEPEPKSVQRARRYEGYTSSETYTNFNAQLDEYRRRTTPAHEVVIQDGQVTEVSKAKPSENHSG